MERKNNSQEFHFGYFEEVDNVKRYQQIKNKFEQFNSWCLDRSVLKEPLDCDSQAVDK